MAVDKPCLALVCKLEKNFPNFEVLSLDPVHLAMAYEKCFARHRSPGSNALRKVLRKFSAVSAGSAGGHWSRQAAYTGKGAPPFSPQEVLLHEPVLM